MLNVFPLLALFCLGLSLHAAPTNFTGTYTQNFDSLGTSGTAMPAGFRALGIPGSNTTYTNTTPITAAGIAAATNNNATLGTWTPGNAGYSGASRLANAGWWGNTADRALATGPTGNGGTVIELSLTNNTGGNLLRVVFSYDLKVMTNGNVGTEASELPGYAFFYSLTGGTSAADWTKVSALSLTNSTPATITSSGSVPITFSTALTNGGLVYFRWADDNNVANSPDQTFAIDNLSVTALATGITSPANNSTYVQSAPLGITAVASAADRTVTNVEFFVDGSEIGEDNTSPYAINWNSPALGGHVLNAVVTDDTGATNISTPVSVSIIAAPATTIARGPYLQLSTPTSIMIRWRTALATDTRVVYGPSTGALTVTNYNGLAVTEHIATLTNLTPDSKYFYAISSTGGPTNGPGTNHSFLTHPLPGTPKPVRIWVLGDAGTGTASQTAVRDAFYAWNGTNTIHAWLQLGDNAYNNGTDAEYQAKFFNIYPTILRNSVTWSTLGNHDANNGDTSPTTDHPYFQMFNFPTAGEAGGVASGTEHYYSFDLGMVHFVCLDSQAASRATNGAMATWLQLDLAANTNHWLIAYWHHPPYSRGSHNSDSEAQLYEMRQNFNPILEAGGVDLVLCGHSHSYERSFLLDGHYGASATFNVASNVVQLGSGRETNGTNAYLKPDNFTGPPIARRGAVYAVPGSSGQISGGSLNHPAMFISLNVLGSVVLDITTNRLDAVFLRETGASNDWFTIRKENFAPVVTNEPTSYIERIYAVTTDNHLISFQNNAPGTILASVLISGLQGAEQILGVDFVGETLYAVGNSSRLYTLDRVSGAATSVGQFTPVISGSWAGVEVEPAGVRVLTDLDQQLVLNTGNGAATVGATLIGSPNPTITGLAYHPGTGVRYVADHVQNTIGTLDPATGLVTPIGATTIDFSRNNGFDISDRSAYTAYLASPAASDDPAANLYTINLGTGVAGLVGLVGHAEDDILIRGLAVGPEFSNVNPTNITFSTSGGNLILSWPADRTGWSLQAQTNPASAGLGTNWFTLAGYETTNVVTLPITPTNPTVFYRLFFSY